MRGLKQAVAPKAETETDTVYIRRLKTMNVPFELCTVWKTTKEQALLDSGATENFLNDAVWQRLKIGRVKLPKPLTVHNVDGMENQTGKVGYYCWLKVYYQYRMAWMKFYITSLGDDDFILGYPFLYLFNPYIDWRAAKLLGGSLRLESVPFRQAEEQMKDCERMVRQLAG